MDVLEDNDILRYPDFLRRKFRYVELDKSPEDLEVFKIYLYVKQFNSEDISIKTTDDTLIVHGSHREHLDKHGFVARKFKWKYCIPEGFEPKSISAILSLNGILKIVAYKKALWDEFLREEHEKFQAYINLKYFPLKELSFSIEDRVMNLHAKLSNTPELFEDIKDATEQSEHFEKEVHHQYYLPRDIVPAHARLVPNEMIEVKARYKFCNKPRPRDREENIHGQYTKSMLEEQISLMLKPKTDLIPAYESWLRYKYD